MHGMALAKLFCELALGVPWLMHVDRYRRRHQIAFKSRRRPDLFGQDATRRWVVVEAKGRSNGIEPGLLPKIVRQKSSIRTIAGVRPWLAMGAISSFDAGTLRLDVLDPPIEDLEGEDVHIDPDEFASAYYEPITELLGRRGTQSQVGGHPVVMVELDAVDLRFGVLTETFESVRTGHPGTAVSERPPIRLTLPAGARQSIGMDGTVIELGPSWEEALMELEPSERA
jgi:hypothetical protein